MVARLRVWGEEGEGVPGLTEVGNSSWPLLVEVRGDGSDGVAYAACRAV